MGLEHILAVIATLFIVSAAGNLLQWYLRRDREKVYRLLVDSCYDRAIAADREHGKRIDGLLDRLQTSPHLEVGPKRLTTYTPSDIPLYSPDDPDPVAQRAWDEAHT